MKSGRFGDNLERKYKEKKMMGYMVKCLQSY